MHAVKATSTAGEEVSLRMRTSELYVSLSCTSL